MDSHLKEIFEKHSDLKGNTIVVLQEIQNHYKYLPEEALKSFAEYFKKPLSEIYGVATFYSQFKFNKPGENTIKVCHGTACHINNAVRISQSIEDMLKVKSGETTPDGKFSVEDVACLGCCSLAPVVMINDNVHGKLDDKNIKKIIREIQR